MNNVRIPILAGMIVKGEVADEWIELNVPDDDDIEKCNKTCKSYSNGFTLYCPLEKCIFHELNREHHVKYTQMTSTMLEVENA
jgi:hypothetical protein